MNLVPVKVARLIQQNGLKGNNQSLMHGNTGICIFFNHLAQKTGNPEYQKTADDLISEVFTNLTSLSPPDFENGLAGIGWGIEYLVQNNFAEGDTDEILGEIDNNIFRILNEESITSFEMTNGLTGYLFYLISRLKNKTLPFSTPQQINRDLLILTINRIYELATAQFPHIVKEINFDLLWRFPVMLLGLSEAFRLSIYNEKINCIIKQWIPNLEAYIPSMHINRLYLAVALMQIYSQIPYPRLEKQIRILLFGTDFNKLKTEINPDQLNIRFGWPGFIILLHQALKLIPPDYPNYSELKSTFKFILKKYKNTLKTTQQSDIVSKSKQLGICEGITGIGLFSLFMTDLIPSKRKGKPEMIALT
jgi:hypothetical protein